MNIACVLRSGGDYTAAHVEVLRANCAEHMPAHTFICLTDEDIPGATKLQRGWRGWWSKMEAFGPLLPDAPTLFLDLDTVLTGPCHDIIKAAMDHDFVILRDVIRGQRKPLAMQSSVMFWRKRPAGVFEKFAASPVALMKQLRGDQDFLESVITNATYWQDIAPGAFVSYKLDVLPQGKPPAGARVIVFHGKPRPWLQTVVPYGQPTLVSRDGWFVPAKDEVALRDTLRHKRDIDVVLMQCDGKKRTAVCAGGFVGIWPATLAKAFANVVTFEPDPANFAALSANTASIPNIRSFNAALNYEEGELQLQHVLPGNAGAHQTSPGKGTPCRTIDSLGIKDCDLIQLDVEGYESHALRGAMETIKASHPVIVVELKGHGVRLGVQDRDVERMLLTLGYKRVGKASRDVIFKYLPEERQTGIQPAVSYSPVAADESVVLVGNGPSVLRGQLGTKIDSFDQVVRFNEFKIRGYERHVGTKTTLWATFGRGTMPHDPDLAPTRIIFIHDKSGDPAVQSSELWRISRTFFWEQVKGWEGATGDKKQQLLPSSGYLVTRWLLDVMQVPKVWLAGFDHFSKEQSRLHHYWIDRSMGRPREHDGDRETAEFKKLEAQGRVAYLRP